MSTDEIKLSFWAEEYLRLRRDRRGLPTAWEQDSPTQYSRVIHIAYPNGVYFAVDKLIAGGNESGENWEQVGGMHYVEATAISNAQKRAYDEDIPYRVRQVVWSG